MSLRNLKFELSDEQVQKRVETFERLRILPEIIDFMERFECPDSIVEANAFQFKNWVLNKRKAESYSAEELENDPSLGQYVDLIYDQSTGILSEQIFELPIVREIAEENAYLSQYVIFDLPLSLHDALFSKISIENENPNYLGVLEDMINFVENDKPGYYLYGNLGIGKSYLSACVSNDFAKSGRNVAFIHVPKLMSHLKQLFTHPTEMEYTLRKLRKVPLLVLDDLGAEPITSWSRDEILLSILNERLENKKKTIITSNYSPDMLVDLYKLDNKGTSDEIRAKRLVDRIHALTIPYEMVGQNRRNK
ncbi:ATP-binding protein [Erysipelothrix amsterdamensis]|uniref:ATP-binding protein n=1 Tax=Erysipelothrix amsterdamensis TaxID=2929157 RepID=A0AAU9VK18_9FIRM|nr:ATP-binding protein [Erysipelothrix sp. A18Y020d]CAH2762824.1 ATP-binding protein [Erysipelothrix sp. A18Y020d]